MVKGVGADKEDLLEKLLAKLDAINTRLDGIEDGMEKNKRVIESLNAGMVERAIKFGTEDLGQVCGVINVGDNELMGENGPRKHGRESEEKRLERRSRQSLGGSLFSAYLASYGLLMAASWLGLIPVFEWELMKFDRAILFSEWLGDHMWVPLLLSLGYVVVVFGIQWAMESRPEFDLRLPLAYWSLLLALFSLGGSLRTVPALAKLMWARGFHHVACEDTRQDWVIDNPAGVWTMLFILSKVPELIDTLFIVLRKRKLITLHWYHHITVMCFCWHSWATYCLNGIVYSAFNLSVHAVMYFFYFLAALGYRPSAFAMYITLIQIAQMVVGCVVTFYVNYHIWFVEPQPLTLRIKATSWDPSDPRASTTPACKVHSSNAFFGLVMYGSYLWLFCLFFYKSYLAPKKPAGSASSKGDKDKDE